MHKVLTNMGSFEQSGYLIALSSSAEVGDILKSLTAGCLDLICVYRDDVVRKMRFPMYCVLHDECSRLFLSSLPWSVSGFGETTTGCNRHSQNELCCADD